MDTITGRIRRAVYLKNSVNGNPNFQVAIETDDGDIELLRTSSDSSCVFDIRNLEGSGERAVFTLTKAGRISTAKRV
jgi:hypothetical protein